MSWGPLTADEIKTRMSGPELTALQTQALASGQADPLPDIISQVTDEVRGYIAASSVPLGQAGELPPQVRAAAIAIVRWRLGGRLAAGGVENLFQTEPRRKEYDDALALLRDVAAGRCVVEAPAVEATETFHHAGAWASDTKLEL